MFALLDVVFVHGPPLYGTAMTYASTISNAA